MNHFVSIGEAARLLGVSVGTLRRWEKEKRFCPDRRTAGGWRLYDRKRLAGALFLERDDRKNV